jgi:hypothetical protein
MRMRVAILAALASGALAGPVQACPLPVAYPGDDAPKEQLAQWMARGAIAAGLPGELPVMGALVESGLQNLDGDDRAGFFGMRTAIWNAGEYAGYPDHPELQLQWFVDYAIRARQERVASGRPDPLSDENAWGDWVADVERPAEQYRGLYQLRLAEARTLIGPPCGAVGAPAPGGTPAPALDTVAPALRVSGPASQRVLRRGAIVVEARCPAEACVAAASATIKLPGSKRALRLAARKRTLGAGEAKTLRLVLDARARTAVRRALRSHPAVTAKVRVAVADAAGNQAIAGRTVRMVG